MKRLNWMMGMAMLATMALGSLAMAQPGGGGGGGGGGGRGGRGNFDPAQFREMMMNRIKEQLGATDDEWKVLQPKIEAVQTAQQDSRGGMMMGFGRRGGPGGPGGDQPQTALQKAAAELRQVVENKDASADDAKAKLAAYREARAAARKKLADAQKELQDLVTAKQEAALVSMGLLE